MRPGCSGQGWDGPRPTATTALPRADLPTCAKNASAPLAPWCLLLDMGVLSRLWAGKCYAQPSCYTPAPDRVCLTSLCSSVPGKKDGETDRNFDTLDLPKRTEAAKGEWVEVESRNRTVQPAKLCASKQA